MPAPAAPVDKEKQKRRFSLHLSSALINTQKRAYAVDSKERERVDGLKKEGASVTRSISGASAAAGAAKHLRADDSEGVIGGKNSKQQEQQKRLVVVCSSESAAAQETAASIAAASGVKVERYPTNAITTSRYSLSPFRMNFVVWKNLYEQFHRRANWFFLFVGILELVPLLRSLDSPVTLPTLCVVLLLGMARTLFEDLRRQHADRVTNNQMVMVLKSFESDKEWRSVPSQEVAVGDIILLEASSRGHSEGVPCDLVVLTTSEVDETCAVQSAHIDGEAKWSMKRALSVTKVPIVGSASFLDGDELSERFVRAVADMYTGMTIVADAPNGAINDFNARLKLRGSLDEFAVRIPQLLLRGTQLRKAKWVVGVCVYTGNETKALMGHEMPTRKWSRVENVVNTLIIASLLVYLALVVVSTVLGVQNQQDGTAWYLGGGISGRDNRWNIAQLLFMYIIFFDNAIPISLYVSLEIVEVVAAFLIEMDLCMYDSQTDRRAAIRAPELLPDLGQVKYLFCDKTGTITRNELMLRKFSARGRVYGSGTTEIGRAVLKHKGQIVPDMARRRDGVDDASCAFYDERFTEETWFTYIDAPHLARLFTAMAVCHTTNVSFKYQRIRRKLRGNTARLLSVKKYEGESPDECALCEASRKFGIEFAERKGDMIVIENRNGSRTTYHVRDVLPFTSERMRMSVIVERADGQFRLLCKGADSVMFPLAVQDKNTAAERKAAAQLASEGLRTLVFGERVLSTTFVSEWLRRDKEVTSMGDVYFESGSKMRRTLAAEVERDMTILGCSAMEDMLQLQVPACFSALRAANIKTWLVTGDSREAAINIGYACGLIPVESHILEMYGVHTDNVDDLRALMKSAMNNNDTLDDDDDWNNDNNNNNSSPLSSPLLSPLRRGNININNSGTIQLTSILSHDGFAASPQGSLRISRPSAASPAALLSPRSDRLEQSAPGMLADSLLLLPQTASYTANSNHVNRSNNNNNGKSAAAARGQQQVVASLEKGNSMDSDINAASAARLFVSILDGTTFATIDSSTDEQFQREAFLMLNRCASVLCARFSSSQKAKAVNFIKAWTKKMNNGEDIVSVAIGDGTNDIPMLRAASVGIGIFGVESVDAANAADFAIAQFWFLQRLLLNHGRSSYRRFALVIKYFLYKNLVYVLMLFFFAMQANWTPQQFLPSHALSLYNILFTSLPIIIAGFMDRDVLSSDDTTRNFPELYWPGQKSASLNFRALLPWIANAVLHMVVIYFFTQVIYGDQVGDNGVTMGADASVLTTYTALVVQVNVHLGVHLSSYSGLTHLGFWISIVGYFFIMMLYSAVPPEVSTSAYRVFNNIGFQYVPWMLAVIAITICAFREVAVHFYIFNLTALAAMSRRRIIQLADSVNAQFASTKPPYELEALQNQENSSNNTSSVVNAQNKISSGSGGSSRNSAISGGDANSKGRGDDVTDQDVSDKLNWLLQFKDTEMEEKFLESFLGRLTRYKVGSLIAAIFSGGVVLVTAAGYVRSGGADRALIEIVGWGLFSLVSIGLLLLLCTQDPAKVRSYIHNVMLGGLLIAFSGMSIANFRSSQRAPDTHPVSMVVAVFGLLVVVRPPLFHIIQYLAIGVISLAMWYQIYRVDAWSWSDILLRTIEFVIVFIISLIGLVIGEKFDRKLFLMQVAIKRSMSTAAEAERRSLVLLNNVLPEGIVAEMSNGRIQRNLADFSVLLQDASVLQSDIVSFTLFSSTKQPHAVVEMLNSMFRKMDAHVSELGITKIKTIGDAYVAAAGVPTADRHHCIKIVTFGLRMVRSVHEMNREGVPSIPDLDIQIRVGAATGPIRAGVVGMEKMRYEVFGSSVACAEKMESGGRPDRVRCSPALYERTCGQFQYETIVDRAAPAHSGGASASVSQPPQHETMYFVVDRGSDSDPYFAEMMNSQLVHTNRRKIRDRFRILDDESVHRKQLLETQDPTLGGKLEKLSLTMANPELEKEFRVYYMSLADARTTTETAQSTIMYALVASIVAIHSKSANSFVVILQLSVAVALALTTAIRVGVPFFREWDRHWFDFKRAVTNALGGRGLDVVQDFDESLLDTSFVTDNLDVGQMRRQDRAGANKSGSINAATGATATVVAVPIFSRRSSNVSSTDDTDMMTRASSNNNSMTSHSNNPNDPHFTSRNKALPEEPTTTERLVAWIKRPSTTVYAVGVLTLLDPIIVLLLTTSDGIGRVAVFIIFAAASFIFSQMHLRFLQKIALASVHLVAVSAAFWVRTHVMESSSHFSRDLGDFVGVLCCYILCVGAAYTTERSVRKAFVASKRVERRNAEIGRTLHLCEKLLHNSIPSSIVRRLQEAPDRAVVDEIPDASVLFLYVEGVVDHNDREQKMVESNNNNDDNNNNNNNLSSPSDSKRKRASSAAAAAAADADDDGTADTVQRMNDVYYVLDALCRFHCVEKIKTVPYLVVSGCPEPLAKHCYRLACLARDTLVFAQWYNKNRACGVPELRIKAGINTGKLTAGVLGSSKFLYDVFGDVVNLASRLAYTSAWGKTCCSDSARRHLQRESVTVTARGSTFLKGKGNQNVFEVVGESIRVPTPNFIEDINTYLENTPMSLLTGGGVTKDPHTTGWSMKSSNMSDKASMNSDGQQHHGAAAAAAAAAMAAASISTFSDLKTTDSFGASINPCSSTTNNNDFSITRSSSGATDPLDVNNLPQFLAEYQFPMSVGPSPEASFDDDPLGFGSVLNARMASSTRPTSATPAAAAAASSSSATTTTTTTPTAPFGLLRPIFTAREVSSSGGSSRRASRDGSRTAISRETASAAINNDNLKINNSSNNRNHTSSSLRAVARDNSALSDTSTRSVVSASGNAGSLRDMSARAYTSDPLFPGSYGDAQQTLLRRRCTLSPQQSVVVSSKTFFNDDDDDTDDDDPLGLGPLEKNAAPLPVKNDSLSQSLLPVIEVRQPSPPLPFSMPFTAADRGRAQYHQRQDAIQSRHHNSNLLGALVGVYRAPPLPFPLPQAKRVAQQARDFDSDFDDLDDFL